ncbi:carbohydrate-binding module family 18 [Amniculicola lignicola CBS 123094]|uniref:Carbohydrate-binding module family 18 n=1 Tax=Amniculicola lignicola CBS 123094 TaxID=1392246 RepID=A0A6A5WLP8_9PLEO|nr:carbohydrate-binding module family 18 [Amniculicola lignicola CBS 123094]
MDYCGSGCQLEFGHCDETKGKASPDGTCGGEVGFTCEGSKFGQCCSQFLFCGDSSSHCGAKCNEDFGLCSSLSNSLSSVTSNSSETPSSTSKTSSNTRSPILKARTEDISTLSPAEQSAAAKSATYTPCPAANNTVFTADCGAQFQVQCSKDHTGGDINWSGNGFYVRTIQDCLNQCSKWEECVTVAWVPGSPKGACYLKSSLGEVDYSRGDWTHSGIKLKNCTTAASSSAIDSASIYTPSSTLLSSTDAPSVTTSTDSASFTTLTQFSPTASSKDAFSTSNGSCIKPAQATPSAKCVPCEGQGGSLPYCGADVTTNNYQFTPKTCKTVYYTLDITNTTIAPDGVERIGLLINGQMPGPLIEANWGDTVVITVNNKLQNNGTSIHFHGIRQLNNSEYDGVASITQCPIAPGDSFTYTWVATNYGTSWYHSHYAIQSWEGVIGPMVIHGPTSKDYDIDVGTIMLQDWTHATVDSMYDAAQDAATGGPRIMDNGLINGMNTWGVQDTANQTGKRFELNTKFEPGKTYLFRIINSAIQSTYKFYIDGHTLEVINMDFTAIKPYKTDILNINIGQRYMVLVSADQEPGDYWMRSDNQAACSATTQGLDIKGIVRYTTNSGSIPTSTAYNYTGACVDEPLVSLVPMASMQATSQDTSFEYDMTIAPNADRLFKWYLSGTTFLAHYDDPTLVHFLANETAPNTSGNLILDLPKMGEWIYIVVESAIPLPHPIHLHGHDFFVLGSGSGSYSSSTPVNLSNPPRRDTAMLPAAGYLVIAFETDNPGTWLMHCHIGWHTSMGFALQILEGKDSIRSTMKDECGLQDTCTNWKAWTAKTGFGQFDSGV